MRKYRNRKASEDGFLFDSLMEHRRYRQLRMIQKAGEISNLKVHPTFVLQTKYFSNSQKKMIQPVKYTADFSYTENNNLVVEDVKGVKTAVFNLKRRLFECAYPTIIFKVVEKV